MVLPSPSASVLLLAGTLLSVAGRCQAGHCWSLMSRNGRCTEILRNYVMKNECCSDGSATTAWSPKDLQSGDLFFWRMFGGGVKCEACKVSCDGVQCGSGMRCVIKRHKPACVCAPKCSKRKRQMGEVCGSDGRTYRHICRLLKRQCRKNKQLSVEYFGKCQKSCSTVQCLGRKTCLLDQNVRPHCVRCKEHCPPAPAGGYICGGDNTTYGSYCHIRQAACVRGRAIQEAYRGKCKGTWNVRTSHRDYSLDVLTHEFQRYNLDILGLQETRWTGKAGATCETIRCRKGKKCLIEPNGGPPRCVTCPDQCQWPKTDKVCATNNYTYASWCHMMQDACKLGVVLEAKNEGPCEVAPSQQTNVIPLHMFSKPSHL